MELGSLQKLHVQRPSAFATILHYYFKQSRLRLTFGVDVPCLSTTLGRHSFSLCPPLYKNRSLKRLQAYQEFIPRSLVRYFAVSEGPDANKGVCLRQTPLFNRYAKELLVHSKMSSAVFSPCGIVT